MLVVASRCRSPLPAAGKLGIAGMGEGWWGERGRRRGERRREEWKGRNRRGRESKIGGVGDPSPNLRQNPGCE